ERQLAGRRGLLDHPHVEKEGVRSLPREHLHAAVCAAILVVCAKRNGAPARREAVALLAWPPGIAPTARDVERAVERELGLTWCKGRLGTHCSDRNRPYSKPIDDRVGEDGRGAGLAERVQYQDKVIWTVGRRERIHIRNVGGRLGERPGPGEVIGHGRTILVTDDRAHRLMGAKLAGTIKLLRWSTRKPASSASLRYVCHSGSAIMAARLRARSTASSNAHRCTSVLMSPLSPCK